MMIFSLVAMTGLEKCCITSAYLQWLCHSGERPVARGPLVLCVLVNIDHILSMADTDTTSTVTLTTTLSTTTPTPGTVFSIIIIVML